MGYQRCTSIFFVLSGYINYVYIYLFIDTKKLSPTFFGVSKFYVKRGSWDMILKITLCSYAFFLHAKKKIFQTHRRHRPFFSKFDVKFEELGYDFQFIHGGQGPQAFSILGEDPRLVVHVLCPSLYRPSTYLSSQGTAQHLHGERKARVINLRLGWVDGMGGGIKSFLQFSLYFAGIYMVYISNYIYVIKTVTKILIGFKS